MEACDGEKTAQKDIVDEYSDVRGLMSPACVDLMLDYSDATEAQIVDSLESLAKHYKELWKRSQPHYVDEIFREVGLITPREVADIIVDTSEIKDKSKETLLKNKVSGWKALLIFPYFAKIRNDIIELAMEKVWKRSQRRSLGG